VTVSSKTILGLGAQETSRNDLGQKNLSLVVWSESQKSQRPMQIWKFWLFILEIGSAGFTLAAVMHNILSGRTGVGKSYIATIQGCESASSGEGKSCTAKTKICENGIIDTIGLDDDRDHQVTDENGNLVNIPGLWYPIYDLFSQLETHKITSATFFLVEDANNPTRGGSVNLFTDFIQNVLGCSLTRVVNKYRDEMDQHRTSVGKDDLIVREGQTESLRLDGVTCELNIPSDWKKLVLRNDLSAIKQQILRDKYSKMTSRKKELEKTIDDKEVYNTNDCKYWGEVGRKCQHFSVLGKCVGGKKAIMDWKTDYDCIRLRDEANKQVDIRNRRRDELRKSVGDLELKIKEEFGSLSMM
jgi:hypothetical protein